MRRSKGFSLIELLIVVAIILLIAAIAIPNFLRSRIAANESSAVAAIRTISTGETTYAATYPTIGYTCILTEMGPPAPGQNFDSTAAGIIDGVLAGSVKSGYTFSLANCNGSPRSTYSSGAVPIHLGYSGRRSFCSDASGVIWQGDDGTVEVCRTSGVVIQ